MATIGKLGGNTSYDLYVYWQEMIAGRILVETRVASWYSPISTQRIAFI